MNMENKDLERAMYIWFNMKYELYNKLEHEDSIYLYYEGEEYADIVIDKRYEQIYYSWDFWEEFSYTFLIKNTDFILIMDNWVEENFNLRGFTFTFRGKYRKGELEIPK